MELNRILFPAPASSYDMSSFPGELIFIPTPDPSAPRIPSLLLKSIQGSSKILLYFHGNAEDIGITYEMTGLIRSVLQLHVLVIEYPGYGLYPGKPTAEQILKDAEIVYNFTRNTLCFSSNDIFAFGRSIGSGPSTSIARLKGLGCLFLMSAYTSIRDVVRTVAGKFAQYFIAERFRNIDNMPYITCPTLLIHGLLDKVIPYSHSQMLHEHCAGLCQLILPKEMDHNLFDYYEDLLLPIVVFLEKAQIDIKPMPGQGFIELPMEFYVLPKEQVVKKNKGRFNKLFMKVNQ